MGDADWVAGALCPAWNKSGEPQAFLVVPGALSSQQAMAGSVSVAGAGAGCFCLVARSGCPLPAICPRRDGERGEMSLVVYAVAASGGQQSVVVGHHEFHGLLEEAEMPLAVRLGELLGSVASSVSQHLNRQYLSEDADLTVEVSGRVTLRSEGGTEFLLLNMGGPAQGPEVNVGENTTMRSTMHAKVRHWAEAQDD